MSKNTPRGIRNKNPGNLEKGPRWKGLAKDQSSDNRFAIFKSPEYGIRALHKTLQTYQVKHGLTTIKGMINRWAPPVENVTSAYVKVVADKVGVSPIVGVDVMKPDVAYNMVDAIIHHENGYNPYEKEVIWKGLEMAGVNIGPLGRTEELQSSAPSSSTPSSSSPSLLGGLLDLVTRLLSKLLRRG